MVHIRPMTENDVPLLMRLKRQAGWNQTEADLNRFLSLEPSGGFIAEWEGVAAGSVMAFSFGSIAWIAMVLVSERLRGKGIGTALVQHAIGHLEARGIVTIRLDATPLGQPIYERLGFTPQYELNRYAGLEPSIAEVAGVDLLQPGEEDDAAALDLEVTGTDRGRLIRALAAEFNDAARVVRGAGRLGGFLIARPGSQAVQIGPCVSVGKAGAALLADACRRYAGSPVYIDVPVPNRAAGTLLKAWGLPIQRQLMRMSRGPIARERVSDLWASSGPEKG